MNVLQGDQYLTVIEGGGSTCRGVRYNLSQHRIEERLILDQHPCNLHRDRDLTAASLTTMLTQLHSLPGPLVLCLPGVSHQDNVNWLQTRLQTQGWGPVYILSDAVAGLWGAFETHSAGQGVFIGGTGAIALGDDGQQLWRSGIADEERACGPWIASEALKHMAHDPQLSVFMAKDSSLAVAERHQLARLAPAVFTAARHGNVTALAILQEAAAAIDLHLTRLMDYGIHDFALCGSVARALRPWVTTPTQLACNDGLAGALLLGLSVYNNPPLLLRLTDLRRIEDHSPLAAQA